MRAFFALALEPPIVAALAECRNAILDADPSWRGEKWVADHNLHITAHFLGDVPEASLANVLDAARSALADVPAFHLAFGTIVAAPRQRAASMLWATPAVGNEESGLIAHRIAAVLPGPSRDAADVPTGTDRGTRLFRAHVTLCRARHPRPIIGEVIACASEQLRLESPTMSVGEVTLLVSTLTRTGPVYEVVGTVPLQS